MTLASVALLAFVWGLFAYDAISLRGRGRRMLALQALLFAMGSVFIAVPDVATRLANRIGIGRGADLVLYVVVVWLVRESLVQRRLRLEDADRTTQIVRSLALLRAHHVDQGTGATAPLAGGQVPSSSASTTT